MARYAIGDIQGCYDELRELLLKIGFSADRDQLWFVGDLVNRGPKSLETLRFVRSLGANATVVLGNHDLHLLALYFGKSDKRKDSDTLDEVLSAPDREALLQWLLNLPLAHYESQSRDLLIHGGLVPQWTLEQTLGLAREVQESLRRDPASLFAEMYGNRPDQWSETLSGMDRLRFTINTLTRMRFCTADGRIDLKMKGPPSSGRAPFLPWFEHENRRTRDVRVIFGHWSALGFHKAPGIVALDTGCVWGGSLTAYDLDADRPPVSLPCSGYQDIE